MSFSLPHLPYAYDALEPFIDTTTMHLHHEKHHQTYITKLNDALKAKSLESLDILTIQKTAGTLAPIIRNNGGGHYNHSLFWKWMAKPGQTNSRPHGTLARQIDQTWGSFEAMQAAFTQAALDRFGSGWAWLGVREADGGLAICSTANQDNPLMAGVVEVPLIPVLGLDVWEHAYYLKYQNRRPEYVEKWWNVVNWDQVVADYEAFASKGRPVPLTTSHM